jgi:molecular chaperone HtpG
MADSNHSDNENFTGSYTYKAETRQLLNILVHSLYTDREIFLRELISNASDALARLNFETLTNREILDPEAELSIHLKTDKEANTLTISDSGIGMTAEELIFIQRSWLRIG